MKNTKRNMTIHVDLQLAIAESDQSKDIPDDERCEFISLKVLETIGFKKAAECTIRVVDENESAELNEQYRGKSGATNILSFPFEMPETGDFSQLENGLVESELLNVEFLGDLVICAPIVAKQALEQSKTESSHWVHLIIHGMLHLLGYDHIIDDEAKTMEALECKLMDELGYCDPYQTQ